MESSLQVAEEEVVVAAEPCVPSSKFEAIYRLLAEGCFPPSFCSIKRKNLKRYAQKFVVDGGCLYYVGPKKEEKREVIVDPERRRQVFLESHFTEIGNHLGQKKTMHRIQSRYYWLGIVKDVVDWIKMCETCQNAEHNKNISRKARPVKVESPWEVLGLAVHGPFPETSQSNTHVLIVTDYFTKWIEAVPLQKKDALSVAKALATIFYRFGASKNIYAGESWDFCEEVSRLLCERWNISQILTPAKPVDCVGLDHRSAEVLRSSICSVVNEKPSEWDAHLDPVLFDFRTSVNSATKYTPFFLMFNRYVCLSSEVDFVKDSKEQSVSSAKADGLPPFTAAVQEQQNAVKEIVIANMTTAYKRERKTMKRKSRVLPSLAFKMEENVFGSNAASSLKKLKKGQFVSFQIETVLPNEQTRVHRDPLPPPSLRSSPFPTHGGAAGTVPQRGGVANVSGGVVTAESPAPNRPSDAPVAPGRSRRRGCGHVLTALGLSPTTLRMRAWKAVASTLVLSGVDVVVTTLLYAHGRRGRDILQDLRHFNIFNSLLDIWGGCLYRSCVLLGAAIGVATNTAYGPRRLRASRTFIAVVCLLMGIYMMVKLLLYSEVRRTIRDPWFWGLFAWTYVALVATFGLWQLLACVTSSREALGHGSESRTEAEESCDAPRDKREEAAGPTIHKLLSYTKPDAVFLGIASFFLLVAALGETFLPYYTGLAIDGIVVQKSMDRFSTAVLVMSLLAIGSSFAAGVRGGVFTLIFARLNIRLRNCLFRSLVSQEMSFFDENRTGDVISRLTSDTTIVSDLVSQNINIFLRNVVKATGVIFFMFSLSWKLSLVTFMGFPIIMLVSDIYGKYYKKLSKDVQNALAKANNTAEETISAMKTVRSFANEEAEANVYWQKLQQVYRLNKREALAYTYYVWSSGLTLLVVQVSILYYGGHLVISGQMTSGNLISFIIYEFVLGDCMESVGSVYSGLMQGVGAAEKVFEFIDRKPTMVNDGSLAPDHVDGKVEFRNVTFSYRTRSATQVLQNVSFTLHPGKVTALVGPSGSGKSSCVNILENFYPLQDGQVLLDGHPINMYDHKYLHSVISLVSQEPVLFARSIADNISYGLASASFESVVQAAQKANAHAFITELQDGYHTEAGEKGAQLSGGQKQRVAIARALIRTPPILILDEATSALDAESEHAIQQAIYGDLQNHTVLVIAHRLSTVEKAHNIIVLDKGRVVQQGSHKELMEEGGLYSKLVQRQILGLEAGSADSRQPTARGDSAKAPGGLEGEFRIDHPLPAAAQDDCNNTAHK